MDDYETIKEPEKRLAGIRLDNARAREVAAVLAELNAEQHQDAVKAYPGNAIAARAATQAAETARETADAMHELAGTEPEDFVGDVLHQIETKIGEMENRHLEASEKQAHPDAYGVNPEQADWDLEVVNAGLARLHKRRAELQAAEPKAPPASPDQG